VRDRTEYYKQWHVKNRARRLVSHKQRYQDKKEELLKYQSEYHKAHPEIGRKSGKKFRSKPDFICHHCRFEFSTDRVHFDHIVPLARGGPHSIDNLCASCSACNLSKGKKLVTEWAPTKIKSHDL
jgi:5-methylcytosine-specific restriction endonuclease McrA